MKELAITAVIENIEQVTDFINSELERYGCSLKVEMQIDVAIDEIFGNICRYAYSPDTGEAAVRLVVENEPLCAVISFIDRGKPFNPLDAAEPDITLSAEQRKVGGLGIFIVRKTMDEVSYSYSEGQNILTIRKNLM
ncbi:MAG: ATP-binding protein [Ruminococcus sp.]|nr:ATP-binding protein [Ruminococcus sp.]